MPWLTTASPPIFAEHLARGIVVLRRAAERREEVHAERQEAVRGEAARHVLDMGAQPAIFVDHDNGRALARAFRALAR